MHIMQCCSRYLQHCPITKYYHLSDCLTEVSLRLFHSFYSRTLIIVQGTQMMYTLSAIPGRRIAIIDKPNQL